MKRELDFERKLLALMLFYLYTFYFTHSIVIQLISHLLLLLGASVAVGEDLYSIQILVLALPPLPPVTEVPVLLYPEALEEIVGGPPLGLVVGDDVLVDVLPAGALEAVLLFDFGGPLGGTFDSGGLSLSVERRTSWGWFS